jgi:hypothetical protein
MNFSSILDGWPGPPARGPNARPVLSLDPVQPLLALNLAVTVTFAEKGKPKPPLERFYAGVLSTLLAMKGCALDRRHASPYVPLGVWHSAEMSAKALKSKSFTSYTRPRQNTGGHRG